ncbi:TonB-dependent siderophore receptor [Tardiphaga sp. 813_E8_N1_3]|uniref:TonB-dependent siderophore receptor n=1 Tax=Tardiphaga sp. 813_E8_N1_3 TaxID=3240760 RepID=UPI003F1E7415
MQPVAAAAPTFVERANGPVNGYVASRSASSTKTDTPILETPQTVSVVSREQIRDQGGQTLGEVLNYVPGVSVQATSFTRVSDNIGIRGFDVAAGNSGLLRDGLKLTSGVYDSTTEPFGLERLEVVKGASSILFGQLGPGGFVNAISKKPTDVPFGEVNATVGDYQRKEISADVGGKLADDGSLLYRFTGLVRKSDTPTNYIPDDKLYAAPSVTWRPDANTSLNVYGYYQESKTRFPTPLPYVGTVLPTSVGTIPRQNFLGEPSFDRFETKAGAVGYQFEHSFNNAVKVRQNLRLYDAVTDWDYLLLGNIGANGRTASRSVSSRVEHGNGFAVDTSAEFKFVAGPTAHTVIAGVDYYRSVLNSDRYAGTASSVDIFNPVYGTPVTVNRTVNNGTNSLSNQVGIYVQDQIKIYDKFVLLLGGRKDFSDVDTRIIRTGALSSQQDEAWTGRAGAVYLFDNGIAPYASFSQSFAPILGTDRLGNPFAPGRGEQYEVGLRYQPIGTRMLFSAAAFEITQQNVLTTDPVNPTFSVQSGEAKSRGIELEAKAEFGGLSIVSAYTYTDARTTQSNTAALIGQRLASVPYNTVSVWGLYDFGALGWHGFKFGGGVRAIGDTNIPGYAYDVPAYAVVDLTASYDLKYFARELNGFHARFNVKNLFNNGYTICVAATGCRYGDPQTVLATVSYRW